MKTAPLPPALETARRIAEHLCATAHSDGGRSTWCGTRSTGDEWDVPVYQTVGPDLYSGTSGIALFLAEAFVRTGVERLRTTAVEAVAQSLEKQQSAPGSAGPGAYDGALGIAYVAARLGEILQRPDLTTRARELTVAMSEPLRSCPAADVISGAAGVIPLLLRLSDMLDLSGAASLAIDMGDAILRAAVREPTGWSWRDEAEDMMDGRNLTGFAHGAAGIGRALLQLHRRTGFDRFIEGGFQAFRYENRWFRPAEDNWPDFRWHEGDEALAPCMVAWCHGAPGIGLARMEAIRMGHEQWRADAEAAVRASKRALGDGHVRRDADFCLCHGVAGIATFLLLAADVLRDESARRCALAAARRGMAAFGQAPRAWPLGLPSGSHPSLMIGLAGIGYFYLGLADPALPSVLLL
jgi:lantibiotic modifying enzyme